MLLGRKLGRAVQVIGFIGLRRAARGAIAAGPDHRLALLRVGAARRRTFVGGSGPARSSLPPVLPLGIVTAAIGGPFFLSLLIRERQKWSAR